LGWIEVRGDDERMDCINKINKFADSGLASSLSPVSQMILCLIYLQH
jgi:hypothetical protein